jgi:cellulose synthase/poly-beta-1,6-N-acetylglucosamine synthase-like glycosyltransferase
MQNKILCSISTRGRYHTTLPLAIQSIITQTHKADKLVVFDDNDEPKDLRNDPIYMHLFRMLDMKGIKWEWLYAGKKGQHHNHQIANTMGYEFVWRMDDDTIAEPDVLEKLFSYMTDNVGAVGGSTLTPNWDCRENNATGLIDNIDKEPNKQWGTISKVQSVDHLHCSFLYRAGIVDYNTGLSPKAHREETLFTFQLKNKGYKLLVIPDCITWHLKLPSGGIRG